MKTYQLVIVVLAILSFGTYSIHEGQWARALMCTLALYVMVTLFPTNNLVNTGMWILKIVVNVFGVIGFLLSSIQTSAVFIMLYGHFAGLPRIMLNASQVFVVASIHVLFTVVAYCQSPLIVESLWKASITLLTVNTVALVTNAFLLVFLYGEPFLSEISAMNTCVLLTHVAILCSLMFPLKKEVQ